MYKITARVKKNPIPENKNIAWPKNGIPVETITTSPVSWFVPVCAIESVLSLIVDKLSSKLKKGFKTITTTTTRVIIAMKAFVNPILQNTPTNLI